MQQQHDGVVNTQYIGPVFRVSDLWEALRSSRGDTAQGLIPASSGRRKLTTEPPPHARLPDTGFVRLPAILGVFPVSRSTWWDGVKNGKYPAAVKLGPNTTAWRVDDIRRLLEQYARNAVA